MNITIFHGLRDDYIEFRAIASHQKKNAPLIGLVGYPAFYILWEYIFPQPFNSITVNAIGWCLSLMLLLPHRWPDSWRQHELAISYLVTIYNIPFFFTFMLLMNDANSVWQLSYMAGSIYLTLLSDPRNTVVMAVIGTILAIFAFFAKTGAFELPQAFLLALIVVSFMTLGFAMLNYRNARAYNARMLTAASLAAAIAHEMRTPLSGIRHDASQCEQLVGKLLKSHDWAKLNGWKGQQLSPVQEAGLSKAFDRIQSHTASANTVIDMLLMNVTPHLETKASDVVSARATIEEALESYGFQPGQREFVTTHLEEEFSFEGSGILMCHVIFNLLKNALRVVERTGSGEIKISLQNSGKRNSIIFEDTGPGIASEHMPFIFVPFYSTEVVGQGTGVGLAFCRMGVEHMGGTITCSSEPGEGTVFKIDLPKYQPEET